MRLLLLLVVAAPAACAFASVPVPSPHEEITRQGAQAADWPAASLPDLVAAVHAPDHKEMAWDPDRDDATGTRLEEDYQPAQHCTRFPGMDNETALADTIRFVHLKRDGAVASDDPDRLVGLLGEALHALQDCYSHSDFVDMDAERQQAFTRALLTNASAPPARITASDPRLERPGMPDDPYPHDVYAKDSPDATQESKQELDGRTKYELARDAATQATTRLLEDVLADLDEDMVRALDGGGSMLSPGAWWTALAICLGRKPQGRSSGSGARG